MPVAVELCAASMEDVILAGELGLDSVELCSWPACGGVTPGMGLIRGAMAQVDLPVRVLVRPHGGGFGYSETDLRWMRDEVEALGALPVCPGPVIGMLGPDGMPDMNALRSTIQGIDPGKVTFHRAVDHATDLLGALDLLLAEGVGRVLTSGGRTLAMDGADMLRAMVERANGRARLAVAGGIAPSNVVRIVEHTGAAEVHFAAQLPETQPMGLPSMSSTHSYTTFATRPDRAKVEGILEALSKAGLR